MRKNCIICWDKLFCLNCKYLALSNQRYTRQKWLNITVFVLFKTIAHAHVVSTINNFND